MRSVLHFAQRFRIPLFFGILCLLYSRVPDAGGVNYFSRFDLTKAVVLDQSYRIDPYVGNTIDWSKRDGHYYTNKAPGASLLGVPAYWTYLKLQGLLGIVGDDFANMRRIDF